MPTREDIDSFKQKINLWGNEAAVLETLGETIEDVLPPEPSLEESLNMGELDQDDLSMDDFLSQAGLDADESAAAEEESFGLDDLLDSPVPETELPDTDDFSIPGDLNDFGDLGFDEIPSTDDASEDISLDSLDAMIAANEELDENAPVEDEIPGLDDFSMDDEIPGLDDLSMDDELPGLDDLSMDDELPGLDDLSMDDELPGLDDLSMDDELPSLDDLSAGDDLDEPGSDDDDLEELDDPGSDDDGLEELGGEEEGFDLDAPGEEFDLSSPDEEIPELGKLEDMSLDMDEDEEAAQFSLGDFGEDFNFQEGISFDDDMDASLDSLDTLDDTFLMDDSEDLEIEEDDVFEISEENLDALQGCLSRLPLNLKISIQDVLAGADDLTGVRYRKLVSMLIKGSSPRLISSEFFNITGKKIELPKGYQKLTGREFELKQSGFLYQFAEKGWPFVRMVAVILVLLGLTVYLSFHFLYRPLQAHIYYTQGLELIEQDEYSEGFALFNKAFFGWGLGKLTIQGWPSKNRFLDYADAYRMRRAFPYALQMYEGLLGEYPSFLRGYLEYGLFLTNKTGEYARSAEILSLGLNRDLYNYDLMLALGDNYMLWSEEDPDRLEDARFQYATALAHYDGNDEIMLRMLRYFLRVQDDSNISILGNIYSKKSGIKGDPAFTALTLSELGGYYIDRNQVSEAKDFLFKAEEIDVSVPDVHYQLSRYFRRTYNMDQEKKALQKALFYMDQAQPLSRSRIFKKIGIYRRRGEIDYEEGLYDNAEEEFEAGIRLLEDSQLRGLIGTNSEIGELYADMGNLHYTVYNDLTGALNYFNKAEKNQYHSGDISYRKGYIYYDQKQYDQAVLEFESALKDMQKTRNTRFALANTLVYRHNFFGARNQYMEILRDLKREESSLPYLAPEDILEHRSLVNHFIRVYNNLAYVDYSLAERGSDQVKQSQALLSLTRAADYADRIDRDPETMVRSRPEDSLVFQNTMALIKPLPESDIYLYDEITRTPEELLSR